jgi:hypothetical protein
LRLQTTTIKPLLSYETREYKKKSILVAGDGLNDDFLSYRWNLVTYLSLLSLTRDIYLVVFANSCQSK